MDDYLSKPIRAAELLAAIARQVEAARGIPRPERPEAADSTPPEDPLA